MLISDKICNNIEDMIYAIDYVRNNIDCRNKNYLLNELAEYLKNILLYEEKMLTRIRFPDISNENKQSHIFLLQYIINSKYCDCKLESFLDAFIECFKLHLKKDNEILPYIRTLEYCALNGV